MYTSIPNSKLTNAVANSQGLTRLAAGLTRVPAGLRVKTQIKAGSSVFCTGTGVRC